MVPLSEVVHVNERPTLLSITRRNRERAMTVFANVAPGKSQAEALGFVQKAGTGNFAGRVPRGSLRQRPDLQGIFRQPDLRPGAGDFRGLHGAGLPVQQLHCIRSRCFWRFPSASRAPSWRLYLGGQNHQPLQHDRRDSAHGHREEELHPAGGFHQRAAARRPARPRTPFWRPAPCASGPSS